MEQGLAASAQSQNELIAKVIELLLQGVSPEEILQQGVPESILQQAMEIVLSQQGGGAPAQDPQMAAPPQTESGLAATAMV